MNEKLHNAISKALGSYVNQVRVNGIKGIEIKQLVISQTQLREAASRLRSVKSVNLKLRVPVYLFLRISNTDVLRADDLAELTVRMNVNEEALNVVIESDKDWAKAWEQGIETLREPALEGMRRDMLRLDDFPEDSSTFQAGIILLASELVGPYADRVSDFLQYPMSLVEVIGTRLQQAQIWVGDEIRCEHWFHPKKGNAAFFLDLLVAEGKLVRIWSEERNDYVYRRDVAQGTTHLVI